MRISVVAVENVLRCGILKLTWALPKKDNRPIPSASPKGLSEPMVELPNFGSSDRSVEPQTGSNANTPICRLGMPRAAAPGQFNSSMRGKHGFANGPTGYTERTCRRYSARCRSNCRIHFWRARKPTQSVLPRRVLALTRLQAGFGSLRTEERIASMDFGTGKPGDGLFGVSLAQYRSLGRSKLTAVQALFRARAVAVLAAFFSSLGGRLLLLIGSSISF
jgi:hypothetical protein